MIRTTTIGRRARPRLATASFLAVSASSLAYFTADGILLPAVPQYVEQGLGGGDLAVGLSVGAFSLSALLLRPWAGRLADRRGRRLLMVAGAAVFAASTLGYLVATTVPLLFALRLLTGAGEALFFVGAASAIADLAPLERRGEAMSLFTLSLYIGIGIGPLLGEALSVRGGFGWAWLAATAMGFLAIGIASRIDEPRIERAVAPGAHRLVHPAGLRPGLLLLAALWGMGGYFAFVPVYAFDLGLDGSRMVLLLFAAIVVGVRSVGARIPDALGPKTTARLALASTAVGLATITVWPTVAGLVAGTSVFAVGVALTTPSILALAVASAPPAERGEVMGTVTMSIDLAFGLGPATLGLAATLVGREGTFLFGAAIAAMGFAYAFGRWIPSKVR